MSYDPQAQGLLSPRGRLSVAIFVKTPGLSSVKSRLSKDLGKDKAEEFYRLSCQATAGVCRYVRSRVPDADIFWAVAEKEAVSARIWRDFPTIYQGSGSLGQRLSEVYKQLGQLSESMVFLGADCPQLSPVVLMESLQQLRRNPDTFQLGPASDGGFWLWGGPSSKSKAPGASDFWLSVTYSSSRTGEQLQGRLRLLGPVAEIQEYRDVDTLEDLIALRQTLRACFARLLAPQKRVLEWIASELPE